MKKIVIIGPESTGKTTLARQLAAHFEGEWVEEYAREYVGKLDRPYTESDLLLIAKGQWSREQEALQSNPSWLFCDTDLRVIKIWSQYKYGRTDPWILQQIDRSECDLYLLKAIDLPWQKDPQREHPHQRQELFDIYYEEIRSSGIPYKLIEGEGDARFQMALQALTALPI